MKRSLIVKLAIGLVALTAFGFLFMRSLQDARATPYTVAQQHLSKWTLALEPASGADDPLLVLRPVPELAAGIFRQVFARAMESLNAPVGPAIPIVLRGEFDRIVGDQLSRDALVAAARSAGLETAMITPKCLVHRRRSEPGLTKQAYFLLVDAPAIVDFRRRLGLDSNAMSPVLFVAGAGSDLNEWLPQRVNAETDCLAPVEVSR